MRGHMCPRRRQSEAEATERIDDEVGGSSAALRGFRIDIIEGPDRARHFLSTARRCTLGVHPSCDLALGDPTVSRFHCELVSDERRVRIRDLGSSNGTIVDGLRVRDADLKSGSLIQFGRTTARFQFLDTPTCIHLSPRTRFGLLVGRSATMRSMFALLERAAPSDVTILLQGETGTGKSATARSVHQESARRDGPFVLADCSALPGTLLESELFGHEKGAFTGAYGKRIGAFEEAHGGTLFLDEIGELPLELQAKLLGVLENREIRRIGSNQSRPVNVRVIAATNRDLRRAVNTGRFREDLYYRLAVVSIEVPPLRERQDDLRALAETLLAQLDVSAERIAVMLTPALLATLQQSSWPGNVRELRNYLQQYILFGPDDAEGDTPGSLGTGETAVPRRAVALPSDSAGAPEPAPGGIAVDVSLPFPAAREQALEVFERLYITELLRVHEGKVSRAAATAGINRSYLYRMLQRHRIPY
jgi:two-component system response regulator GlrR